jgi:hypothetical protein
MPSKTYLILRSAPQGRVSKDARGICNKRSKILRSPAGPFPAEP